SATPRPSRRPPPRASSRAGVRRRGHRDGDTPCARQPVPGGAAHGHRVHAPVVLGPRGDLAADEGGIRGGVLQDRRGRRPGAGDGPRDEEGAAAQEAEVDSVVLREHGDGGEQCGGEEEEAAYGVGVEGVESQEGQEVAPLVLRQAEHWKQEVVQGCPIDRQAVIVRVSRERGEGGVGIICGVLGSPEDGAGDFRRTVSGRRATPHGNQGCEFCCHPKRVANYASDLGQVPAQLQLTTKPFITDTPSVGTKIMIESHNKDFQSNYP
ncbi:hypothetical protein THAOC_29399, partial [Thalassiosira oceanica]